MVSLPDAINLRLLRAEELETLPERLSSWYPEALVGSESIFLSREFLRRELVHEGKREADFFAMFIEKAGEVVGFTSFERQRTTATLQARLGALAPEARTGFLGALGFLTFEKLAMLTGAELMLVWITLASRHQQVFAERRGFQLVGVVPGVDRERAPDGRTMRVTQALLAKLLVSETELVTPSPEALTPRTARVLEAIRRG